MGIDSSDLFGPLTKAPVLTRVVPVLVPLPVPGPYSYAVPEGVHVEPGSVVQVPVGPRQVIGVVWDGDDDASSTGGKAVDPKKLRPITLVFDCPPLSKEMRDFVEWVASYTLSPPGLVARMAIRAPAALDPEPMVEGLRYLGGQPDRVTPARAKVLDRVGEDDIPWTRSGLAHAAGVSLSVIDGLIGQGIFDTVFLPPPPVVAPPDPDYVAPRIEGPQKEAAEEILGAIRAGGFSASLIDGVTGSGKTEVYFEAIAETLRRGKQVLILLPEIALTASFLDRFHDRFGSKPAEWHSDLSPRTREKVWRGVVMGEVKVVAGARSALFLPFEDLGLIIVDEEHDPAYKQEDRVFYNARDMAVVRARIGDFPIVLVSATPSVESQVNGLAGRYTTVHMPTRFGDAALPDLHLVDMRRHPPQRGGFLSPILLRGMAKTLEKKQQSLLFLNRRGYAPLTLCRVCGHRFQCPQCSSWLVEHRFKSQIQCHQCGYHEHTPEACPECGTLDHLVLRAGGGADRRRSGEAFSRCAHDRAVVGSARRRQARQA